MHKASGICWLRSRCGNKLNKIISKIDQFWSKYCYKLAQYCKNNHCRVLYANVSRFLLHKIMPRIHCANQAAYKKLPPTSYNFVTVRSYNDRNRPPVTL